jgi:hypothetical protein
VQRKRSVALAIANPADASQILVVQRPADDDDLPSAWGLPAASLKSDEDWQAAARRAGRDKLGVSLTVGPELNRGEVQRSGYTLEMRLYQALITGGEPAVPQSDSTVTQYQAWKWDDARVLQPAAQRGSLCCRLYLELDR